MDFVCRAIIQIDYGTFFKMIWFDCDKCAYVSRVENYLKAVTHTNTHTHIDEGQH